MVTIDMKLSYVRALNSWGIISKGNDNLPALMNVALFRGDGEEITAIATNRYSIVQHSTVISPDGNIREISFGSEQQEHFEDYVLIPFAVLGQFVKAATAYKNGDVPVQVRISDDYVEIQMYEVLVRGAKIRGQYPRVDKLMAEKQPAKNGFRVFGLPSKEFTYLPKLIAPNSNYKPTDYNYNVTFSDSSTSEQAGPMVLTTESDKDFMVVIQPRYAVGATWMGANNG